MLTPVDGADQRSSRRYRADIDGLRALAVLSITGFHLGFRFVGGGYVGVDIFFVISGYLIGGAVLRERRAGTFSLSRFYERRLRRIGPALAVVLIVTTLASMLILFPRPLSEYARSLITIPLSVSNIYFWSTANYFGSTADAAPLLHTWSLGVEEQFYLLFPPILFFIHRLRLPTMPSLAAMAAASFAISVVGVSRFPDLTFYLLPTRIWELLLGVIATEMRWPRRIERPGRELAGVAGLGLAIAPILLYSAATPFPGVAALMPCLGTAMVLAAGSGRATLASRILSFKPAVFFGLISYSLYLWHWPVIVLIRQGMPEGWLRMPDRAAALALAVALAAGSWWFVERPFRSARVSGRAVLGFCGLSTLLILGLAAAVLVARGLPQRFDHRIVALTRYMNAAPGIREECIVGLYKKAEDFDARACLAERADRPNVLVFGDSHAFHLWPGLQQRFPEINFTLAAAAGCRTTIVGTPNETRACRDFRAMMFRGHLVRRPPAWVLLSNFWGPEGLDAVGPTLDWFRAHGIRVILAGPIVRYEVPLPQALAIAELRRSPGVLDRVRVPETDQLDRDFAAVAARHHVPYMSPYRTLCPRSGCRTEVAPGVPVQFDYGHLTAAGSFLVAAGFPSGAVDPAPGIRR